MDLHLPRELKKGDVVQTVATPTEYWNKLAAGYQPVELSPQQKAARTRAANKGEGTSVHSQNPDVDPTAQAGNATGDES